MKMPDKNSVSKTRFRRLNIPQKYSMFFIMLLVIVVASFLSPAFAKTTNVMNISRQIAATTIIAFAETLLLISGQTDLAPGSILALCGCMGVMLSVQYNVFVGLLVAILVGILCGAFSGLIITKFNLPPFIVTLATQNITRGLALVYMGGKPFYGVPASFKVLGQGQIGAVPYSLLICILVGFVAWFVLHQTRFGRYIYATGGNVEAAKASGINVSRLKIGLFLFSGACSGLAGFLLMSRVAAALPDAGSGYEFDAIIAVVVGGTSMSGGVGTIGGTVIGAIIVGVLNNIMNLMGIQSYWQSVVKGIIIALAVILDSMSQKRQQSVKVLLKEEE